MPATEICEYIYEVADGCEALVVTEWNGKQPSRHLFNGRIVVYNCAAIRFFIDKVDKRPADDP